MADQKECEECEERMDDCLCWAYHACATCGTLIQGASPSCLACEPSSGPPVRNRRALEADLERRLKRADYYTRP